MSLFSKVLYSQGKQCSRADDDDDNDGGCGAATTTTTISNFLFPLSTNFPLPFIWMENINKREKFASSFAYYITFKAFGWITNRVESRKRETRRGVRKAQYPLNFHEKLKIWVNKEKKKLLWCKLRATRVQVSLGFVFHVGKLCTNNRFLFFTQGRLDCIPFKIWRRPFRISCRVNSIFNFNCSMVFPLLNIFPVSFTQVKINFGLLESFFFFLIFF